METHTFMDGKVHLYKRQRSRFWQCSTYMDGRNHRVSTKEESLTLAKEFAREWYMAVYVDSRRRGHGTRTTLFLKKFGVEEGAVTESRTLIEKDKKESGPTFREAAEKFMAEYEIITQGQRNKAWTEQHKLRIRVHLMPFFGDRALSEINGGLFNEYRMHRATNGYKGRIPSRSTLHHETVTMNAIGVKNRTTSWLDSASAGYFSAL